MYDPVDIEDIDYLDKIDNLTNLPNLFDLIVLATDHDIFKDLSPEFLKTISINSTPILADGRGLYNKDVLEEKRFKYVGIGL